jgi:hypothetical protein
MATPDVGQGQRGRVVDPVTGHDDRCPPLFPAHRVELAVRGQPGEHLVDAGERPDDGRRLGAVAGREDDPRDAAAAQRPDRLPGVRPDPVLQQQRARGLAVHRDEHSEGPVQPGSPADGPDPRPSVWRCARHRGPLGPAEPDRPASDRSRDALPGLLGHLRGLGQRAAALGGRADDRGRQDVSGGLVE